MGWGGGGIGIYGETATESNIVQLARNLHVSLPPARVNRGVIANPNKKNKLVTFLRQSTLSNHLDFSSTSFHSHYSHRPILAKRLTLPPMELPPDEFQTLIRDALSETWDHLVGDLYQSAEPNRERGVHMHRHIVKDDASYYAHAHKDNTDTYEGTTLDGADIPENDELPSQPGDCPDWAEFVKTAGEMGIQQLDQVGIDAQFRRIMVQVLKNRKQVEMVAGGVGVGAQPATSFLASLTADIRSMFGSFRSNRSLISRTSPSLKSGNP